ncbi:unnamed protein product [Peniophora sp. CBMAI 1063]|nr:unnamed protein product [Peniophora sp. CBMAI 1063]
MGFGKLALAAAAYKAAAEELEHSPEPQPQAPATSSSARRPLLPQASGSGISTTGNGYGATHSRHYSPEALRRTNSAESGYGFGNGNGAVLDDEAVESLLDEAGLFVGNYRTYVLLYAFVPLACIVFLALLAPIPAYLHTPAPSSPFPFPELLLGAALWSLAYVLAPPLYTLFSLLPLPPALSTSLAASTHAVLRNALRVAALPILELSQPMGGHTTYRSAAFAHVWAFAMGCGAADACAGVWQGYSQLALYRDVMVSPEEARRVVGAWLRGRARSSAHHQHQPHHNQQQHGYQHTQSTSTSTSPEHGHGHSHPRPLRVNSTGALARTELEHDLDALVSLKAREDLEELYGVHIVGIPVFVTCVLRVASLALLLGFTLVMSAAWLSSPYASASTAFSRQSSSSRQMVLLPHTESVGPFWVTFVVVCVAHGALATVHAPPLLRRVGAHAAAYVGLVLGLGALFAGLGMWDVLA